jgi:hypothetical protein
MLLQIRWARAISIAFGLTLFVAGVMPGAASAHSRKAACRSIGTGCLAPHQVPKAHGALVSGGHFAKVSQAKGRTLVFGSGDTFDAGPPTNIDPNEPLTNLSTILASAGYGVDVDESSTLPSHISQYRTIWYISTDPLSSGEEAELEAFVAGGGGLYLTGEGPCCEALNTADTAVVNALVTAGGVEAGGQGFADDGIDPEPVSADVIDDAAEIPNVLSTWSPNGPGGMQGVAPPNVFSSTDFLGQPLPTGALWDGSSMASGIGRLAVLMDINWLESETWNPTTATQVVINLERFLMSALPVHVIKNAHWSGYAAKAHGVQDVNAEWTVPTVDCSQAAQPSAVRILAGIDGFGNKAFAGAGVGVTCSGPTSSPCYYLFTAVHLSNETPISACGGVNAGDDVSVDIANKPFGSSTFVATIKVNGDMFDNQTFSLFEPSKRDSSAECVVELPTAPVGPGTAAHYSQLADFGAVAMTDCQATATQNAGDTLDTESLATGSDGALAVRALTMGKGARSLASTTAPTFPGLDWSANWLAAK